MMFATSVQEVIEQTRTEDRRNLAVMMLLDREDIAKIMRYTKLTREEIEKIQKNIEETRIEERYNFAEMLLLDGVDITKIMKYTKLTREEIEEIQKGMLVTN